MATKTLASLRARLKELETDKTFVAGLAGQLVQELWPNNVQTRSFTEIIAEVRRLKAELVAHAANADGLRKELEAVKRLAISAGQPGVKTESERPMHPYTIPRTAITAVGDALGVLHRSGWKIRVDS